MGKTSTRKGNARRCWITALLALCVTLIGLLAFGGSASAKVVYKWVYNGTYPSGSIDGSGSIPGDHLPFNGFETVGGLEIDQASNSLYVGYEIPEAFPAAEHRIYKFDLAGVPKAFSALDPNTVLTNTVLGRRDPIAVDNTGTSTQGRIYIANTDFGSPELRAYLPSGLPFTGGSFPVKNFPDVPICGPTVAPDGNIWVSYSSGLNNRPHGSIREYTPNGEPTGDVIYPRFDNHGINTNWCGMAFDSKGNLYTTERFLPGTVAKFSPAGVKYRGPLDPGQFAEFIAIDHSNDDLFVSTGNAINQYDADGGFVGSFGGAEAPNYPGTATYLGVAVDEDTHTVYAVGTHFPQKVDTFVRTEPKTVPTTKTTSPPDVTPASAVLYGVVNADGIDTTDCHFELLSSNFSLITNKPCAEGNVFSAASGDHEVHAEVGSLTKGTEYHFRLTAKNANNVVSRGRIASFRASSDPTLNDVTATNVDTGGARLEGEINPNGSETSYQFEWGTEAGVYTHSVPLPQPPEGYLESPQTAEVINEELTGLSASSTYHFRLTAKNDAGESVSTDRKFTTFPKDPSVDACENAHVRQQTGARLLLDCRAYELVSASNAGGYDVESDLAAGHEPLVSSPTASDRVLYSTDFGSIPGIAGSPTNFGHDPYVASRGEDGWTTEYVGLPADGMTDKDPFGSPLFGFDEALRRFAFAGADICNPCFADGSSNIPLRLADHSLVKGMAGSLSPAADPVGEVREPFSGDGSHFVFGADQQFEAAGNSGSVSIYDRNLSGGTQVASTLPNGATMSGEVAELGVSENGSRIVVAQRLSTDGKGNGYYHPYMHIGNSPNSVDLAPGTTTGALYNGMSANGSDVFLTTKDKLLVADTDNSADIYRAHVDAGGSLTLSLVSIEGGNPSNSDACSPPGEWNVVSGGPDCSAVALAGGAGVATEDGTIYFVSPEQLEGPTDGEANQANLFVLPPGGEPHFVATLDSSVGKPPPAPPYHPFAQGSFGGSLTNPEAMTVDQSNGDVYVREASAHRVARFTSAGAPHNFTAGPGAGTNKISVPGVGLLGPSTSEIAVDNSGGPFDGAFYVTNYPKISVYAPSGEKLGDLDGSPVPFFGEFIVPCGVAVDQSNGAVYIAEGEGAIWRYEPTGSAPISDADYSITGRVAEGINPCSLAADSSGHVYASSVPNGPVKEFDASSFEAPFGFGPGVQVNASGMALSVDPSNNQLYVNEGPQVAVFSETLGAAIETFGLTKIANSRGVAVSSSNHHAYAANGGNVVEFGYVTPPYTPIDNAAVVHGVGQAGTHSFGDFQVTPDGRYAAFSSVRALTGYPTAGHSELYRYDAQTDVIDCVSCPPSNVNATSDTSLPPYGLSLTDDGRVFFTTAEQLVLRDTNRKLDAYEWEDGNAQLISTGIIRLDASLLSASADGRNAYFFTRETLSAQDHNGSAVKIYDAREGGGFASLPERVPCAASDECHGPGTEAPPPPSINTVTGSGRSHQGSGQQKCKKGFVRRHGKCVKRHRKKRHSTRRHG